MTRKQWFTSTLVLAFVAALGASGCGEPLDGTDESSAVTATAPGTASTAPAAAPAPVSDPAVAPSPNPSPTPATSAPSAPPAAPADLAPTQLLAAPPGPAIVNGLPVFYWIAYADNNGALDVRSCNYDSTTGKNVTRTFADNGAPLTYTNATCSYNNGPTKVVIAGSTLSINLNAPVVYCVAACQ
jgi:hypothetical protein